MSERDQKEVGTFEVASGIIVVSDPCYDMDTWCRGNIDNVHDEAYALGAQNAYFVDPSPPRTVSLSVIYKF